MYFEEFIVTTPIFGVTYCHVMKPVVVLIVYAFVLHLQGRTVYF
jgi:hypothetical protein